MGSDDKKHIAVIDDETSVTETLEFFLSQYYRVSVYSDGEAFLKNAESEVPDLIVSDFMMQIMDGITLAKKLRALSTYQSVPILMITALGDTELENAKTVGITEYITKPFNIQDVLAAIQKYI